MKKRLTVPLLKAMQEAVNAALAGEFDGGDFDGLNREHFERAASWLAQELKQRTVKKS